MIVGYEGFKPKKNYLGEFSHAIEPYGFPSVSIFLECVIDRVGQDGDRGDFFIGTIDELVHQGLKDELTAWKLSKILTEGLDDLEKDFVKWRIRKLNLLEFGRKLRRTVRNIFQVG